MSLWEGIDYIERVLNRTSNRLSYVIVPGSAGPLPMHEQMERIQEARKVYDWLADQKAPTRSAKRWQEFQLISLKGKLGRALKRVPEVDL